MLTFNSFNESKKAIVNALESREIKRSTYVRESLTALIDGGKVHTATSSRRGVNDWTSKVAAVLDALNVAYETGNDAPRGGAAGRFIRLLSDEEIAVKIERAEKNEEARLEALRTALGNGYPEECTVYPNMARVHPNELPADAFDGVVALFASKGYKVTVEALRHNYGAWYCDYKSDYVDRENGYSLFTPCGCNALRFDARPDSPEDYTYIC